jgi:hypothetical protein
VTTYKQPIPVTIEVAEENTLVRGIYWDSPVFRDDLSWELTFMVTAVLRSGRQEHTGGVMVPGQLYRVDASSL